VVERWVAACSTWPCPCGDGTEDGEEEDENENEEERRICDLRGEEKRSRNIIRKTQKTKTTCSRKFF